MNEEKIVEIVKKQREYFLSGKTIPVSARKEALKALLNGMEKYRYELEEAIKLDLGKGSMESFMCETGLSMSEIRFMLKHVKRYAKEKTVMTPLVHFHSRSYKLPTPYGVTLVMSPWNYPVLLTIEPLADALAAGNTVIVKPSAYSPNTTKILGKLINECFDERLVAFVDGGRAENKALLNQKFDYIFFTGSKAVGKEVMAKAAVYLTPVTLELGGKSPCIITKDANLKHAAKRLVFGKYLNAGQTCVAPDYVYCQKDIKDEFVKCLLEEIPKQFGKDALSNDNYGKIINEKHFSRVSSLINKEKVVYGGKTDEKTLKIEPTVMDNITFDDAVMQEEIFGPLMPILTYNTEDEIIDKINSMDSPLALYVFTSSKKTAKKITNRIRYGGGCINDTIIHLANSVMGFGGVGESGMGEYHGKAGFDTFTHYKSIVDKKTWLDLPMRYQPYKSLWEKVVHLVLK